MLWSKSFECGISAIDEQHKEIFRQVEVLTDVSNRERIPEMLDFLGQYVVNHFSTEEEMHLRYNYPKTEEHKAQHAAFIQTYLVLRKEYLASRGNLHQSLQAAVKVNQAVFAWLREHIMGSDKEFSVYFKNLKK